MAEEEVAAPAVSPVSTDCKRKFEDLQPESTVEQPLESNIDGGETAVAVTDEGENKRPRLDDNRDDLANANGHKDEQVVEPEKEAEEGSTLENVPIEDGQDVSKDLPEANANEQTSSEVGEPTAAEVTEIPVEESGQENAEEPSKETQQPSQDLNEQDTSSGDKQSNSVDPEAQNAELPNDKQDASSEQKEPSSGSDVTTRKIEVPNNKVGVLIGKAGETIRYLQYNSGAKIQITRDADADPHLATRPVELIGTLESIEKAEKLMNAVIAEADAGGSPALVARGLSPAPTTVGSEQIQIQVPNEKVGLIIGKGGETIKGLQTKTGARVQLIPQHLPEGDDSKERTVQVTGDKRQIELAQELIKEVLSQPVRPSTGGFGQQAYRPPRGSGGTPQWGQRGSHFGHRTSYDYQQRGPYPSHNQPYAAPPYGNYPQHMAPRSSYGWEQRPHHSLQGPPSHNGGYDYYGGQQGGHLSDAPPSAQHTSTIPQHGTGPSPQPSMGPSPVQMNYNYGQPQGHDYGHQTQGPYPQAGHPQQGYGQGYDESKYENRALAQHPYGGHVNSQPTYPQPNAQPNYAAPQQYGKPPVYGMPPSQGQHPQSYGHPRATQPGEMYQGSTPAQSYGTNMPMQQPYPYASSGSSQAAYPTYGSAPATDGYNHPQSASGAVYAQPGGQPSYAQPGAQPYAQSGAQPYAQPGAQPTAGYGQVGPNSYGAYPSAQQTYPEQPASNNAAYGYQAPQDPGYSSGAAPAYNAAPAGQSGYVQPTPIQTGYEQSNPQPTGYAAAAVPAAAAAPAAYGKTLSPQPQPQPAAYPQYDATQVYGAPR